MVLGDKLIKLVRLVPYLAGGEEFTTHTIVQLFFNYVVHF